MLDEFSEQQVLEDIFVKMVMTLKTLEKYFMPQISDNNK